MRSALGPTASSRNRRGRSRRSWRNRRDETDAHELADVFAAGDCVETYHRLLDAPTYISLGTIAHKQGRVAGENAVGGDRIFAGALGTQSLKVFDLAIARTGLSDREARAARFDPVTVGWKPMTIRPIIQAPRRSHPPDGRPAYWPAAGRPNRGQSKAEISKRIDIVATALFQDASVEYLNDLDLSYTPPFSSPWDPVQMAAQAWCTKLRKLVGSIRREGTRCTQTGRGLLCGKFHPRAANRPDESPRRASASATVIGQVIVN